MVGVYYLILFYINWANQATGTNPSETNMFWLWTYTISHYSVGALQLVSGVFLLVAVYLIRRFLVDTGMGNHVNYQSMTLHAVSFTLYNVSVVCLYLSYFYYVRDAVNVTKE